MPLTLTQLSRTDYSNRVQEFAADATSDSAQDILWCLPSDADMERVRKSMKAFCMDPAEGREGLLEIYDIGQARAALNRPNFSVQNWQYDRRARVLLINLRAGSHEALSAELFRFYSGRTEMRTEDAAEAFIAAGMGWFRSAASNGRPLKGKDVRLDAQERVVFDMEFMTV